MQNKCKKLNATVLKINNRENLLNELMMVVGLFGGPYASAKECVYFTRVSRLTCVFLIIT